MNKDICDLGRRRNTKLQILKSKALITAMK